MVAAAGPSMEWLWKFICFGARASPIFSQRNLLVLSFVCIPYYARHPQQAYPKGAWRVIVQATVNFMAAVDEKDMALLHDRQGA